MYRYYFNYKDELYHHGIKNQHWGVRNGPPYPLDRKVSNRIKKGKNERVRSTNAEYRKKRNSKKNRAGLSKYATSWERSFKEKSYVSSFGAMSLSEISKSLSSISDSYGEMNTLKDLSNLVSIYGKPVKTIENNDSKMTYFDKAIDDDDISNINPSYGKTNDPGVYNNCVKCSAALAMTRKGVPMSAGRAVNGMHKDAMQYYFDGAVPYKEKPNNVEQRMNKFGNNGYGELIVSRDDGSSHSVFFENLKEKNENGTYKYRIIDGQTSATYSSFSDLMEKEAASDDAFVQITRLDTATPNLDHMSEDSVLRTSKTVVYNYDSGQRFDGSSVQWR